MQVNREFSCGYTHPEVEKAFYVRSLNKIFLVSM